MGAKLRLVCPNDKCINKSIVYRNPNTISNWDCKRCGTRLVNFRSSLEIKQNSRAKKELSEFNGTST